MKVRISFRMFSLTAALALTLGLTGYASAHSALSTNSKTSMQQATSAATEAETEAATAAPIDPDQPVALTLGKAATTPLDQNDVPHRIFTFKGKADELISVSVSVLSGNMSYDVTVNDQSSSEIAKANGSFVVASMFTIKLPQDGNYTVRVTADDPGAGDFAAGSVSVLAAQATASAQATQAASS